MDNIFGAKEFSLQAPPKTLPLFAERNPAQQQSIRKKATWEFAGAELLVLGFEGEQKRSTRPAARVLTVDTTDPLFRILIYSLTSEYGLDDVGVRNRITGYLKQVLTKYNKVCPLTHFY